MPYMDGRYGRTSPANFRSLSTFELVLVTCLFCFFISGCIGQIGPQSGSPSLVASTNSVELGDVQIGNGASATISLVNKSAIPVAVIQLNVVGQFFSVAGHDSFPVSVPAGGT